LLPVVVTVVNAGRAFRSVSLQFVQFYDKVEISYQEVRLAEPPNFPEIVFDALTSC
jgi:hypothetical protein